MIELETTFLAKHLPEGLSSCKNAEYIDTYIPQSAPHPLLRLRKRGEVLEMTKKTLVSGTDSSKLREETISLSDDEFTALSGVAGKTVQKIRYQYPFEGRVAEIDVFQGALLGLVVVDFEFTSEAEQAAFAMPDFCLADVTQEVFIAGGVLAGQTYSDIEADLARFQYKKL